SQLGTQVEVGLGLECEAPRLAPGAQHRVVVGRAALGDAWVREVRDLLEARRELLLDRLELALEGRDALARLPRLLAQRRGVAARLHDLPDLSRGVVSRLLEPLDLHQQAAPLRVQLLKRLEQRGIGAALAKRLRDLVEVLAYVSRVEHGRIVAVVY